MHSEITTPKTVLTTNWGIIKAHAKVKKKDPTKKLLKISLSGSSECVKSLFLVKNNTIIAVNITIIKKLRKLTPEPTKGVSKETIKGCTKVRRKVTKPLNTPNIKPPTGDISKKKSFLAKNSSQIREEKQVKRQPNIKHTIMLIIRVVI